MISYLDLFSSTLFHSADGTLCSCTVAYDSRNVLCTCAALSLLCSAVYEGTDLNALADVKEADSFRSVQLMSAGAEHVDA